MSEYLDRNGLPIIEEDFLNKINDPNYREVAFDKLFDGTTVSTTWTGIPARYGPSGPEVFKTVVHFPNQTRVETYQYSSEELALKSHTHLVKTHHNERVTVSRWTQITNEI